jgi:hypothetical protein
LAVAEEEQQRVVTEELAERLEAQIWSMMAAVEAVLEARDSRSLAKVAVLDLLKKAAVAVQAAEGNYSSWSQVEEVVLSPAPEMQLMAWRLVLEELSWDLPEDSEPLAMTPCAQDPSWVLDHSSEALTGRKQKVMTEGVVLLQLESEELMVSKSPSLNMRILRQLQYSHHRFSSSASAYLQRKCPLIVVLFPPHWNHLSLHQYHCWLEHGCHH